MDALLIVSVVIVVVVAALFARAVRVVPQFRAGIVMRLGRYHRTLQPGLNLVMPILDQVQLVDMAERMHVLQPVQAYTDDNELATIEGVVVFRVISPEQATFNISEPAVAIQKISEHVLRENAATDTLQGLQTSRAQVNDALRDKLGWEARQWGVEIHRVDVVLRPGGAISPSP